MRQLERDHALLQHTYQEAVRKVETESDKRKKVCKEVTSLFNVALLGYDDIVDAIVLISDGT